ncbi:MAG TPA: YciI family protein [Methylomirabilota bacterium]|nr:YciI family protein [Methylomirabilota bacterium]
MRYLLLICNDKNAAPMTATEAQSLTEGHRKFQDELQAAGKLLGGERLRPEADATRVRNRSGQRHVMDGPFAETKEALGGFYLIDCEDRKEAVEWAGKMPLREGGAVDIREIWPI